MKILAALAAIAALCASALAYNPVPATKSAAEAELNAALDHATSDSAKLKIAEDALNAHPDDILVGRAAEAIILKFDGDPVTYFKTRAEKSGTVAAHYLYGDISGRAMGDSVVPAEEANWILKKDPNNFWAHMLLGDAEWNKGKPDLALVQQDYEAAISADPSQPDGYLYLGWAFEDAEKWPEARAAFDAGAVADPSNKMITEQRLTTYAQLHDGAAYLNLAKTVFPDTPLSLDLFRANREGKVTTADLLGKTTVIEYWAFT